MDYKEYKNKDFGILSDKQKLVLQLAIEGKTQNEIAYIIGCSKQNVFYLLKKSCMTLDGINNKSSKNNTINLEQFRKCDLSILTKGERKVFCLRLENKTYSEIAKILGISSGSVGVLLSNAKKRLSGEKTYGQIWNEKNGEMRNAKRKGNPEYAALQKKYYQKRKEKMTDADRKKISENNKKYYQKKISERKTTENSNE